MAYFRSDSDIIGVFFCWGGGGGVNMNGSEGLFVYLVGSPKVGKAGDRKQKKNMDSLK